MSEHIGESSRRLASSWSDAESGKVRLLQGGIGEFWATTLRRTVWFPSNRKSRQFKNTRCPETGSPYGYSSESFSWVKSFIPFFAERTDLNSTKILWSMFSFGFFFISFDIYGCLGTDFEGFPNASSGRRGTCDGLWSLVLRPIEVKYQYGMPIVWACESFKNLFFSTCDRSFGFEVPTKQEDT